MRSHTFVALLPVIILAILGGGSVQSQKRSYQKRAVEKNRPPAIQSFTRTTLGTSYLCPWAMLPSHCADKIQSELQVKASDPDGDVLSFNYSVTSGEIVGQGSAVNWELSKIGSFKA